MVHQAAAGGRLPVIRWRPAVAPRRAASCAAAIVAADNAAQASVFGQLPPLDQISPGGSSCLTLRHPDSSPRSVSFVATIAAPAPTSIHIVWREVAFCFHLIWPPD